MKVIFTCGGTGGHINPAIAVAKILKERRPECEILFVGADDGMETRLVPREGFRLETLTISNYLRSLKPSAIWHNIQTVSTIRKALKRAEQIIRDFQPDVIVGTGGYASFPNMIFFFLLQQKECHNQTGNKQGNKQKKNFKLRLCKLPFYFQSKHISLFFLK